MVAVRQEFGRQPYALSIRQPASDPRAGAYRRKMADGTLGWPAIPVSQLVGSTTRFPFSARRCRWLCHGPGDRGVPHLLCRLRPRAHTLRYHCRQIAARGPCVRLPCRNVGRSDCVGQCHRRDGTLSTPHRPGIAAKRHLAFPGACQQVPGTGSAPRRRGAGGGLGARGLRSPRSFFEQIVAYTFQSVITGACRGAIGAVISSGG